MLPDGSAREQDGREQRSVVAALTVTGVLEVGDGMHHLGFRWEAGPGGASRSYRQADGL